MTSPYPPAKESPGGGTARIGRPPQWTSSRSRKLARLYMYTTLSLDKILKVLEDDVFKPRKNSAQKTIHNMLDHDPRYLRPESRDDMNQRIRWLSASAGRRRRKEESPQQQPQPLPRVPFADVPEEVKVEPGTGAASVHEMDDPDIGAPFSSWKGFHGLPAARNLSSHSLAPSVGGRQHLDPLEPTAFFEESDTNSPAVRDLKNRLSGCSTHYASQISNLLRKFTIGSESDLSRTPPSLTRQQSLSSVEGYGGGQDLPGALSMDAGTVILPGDLLNADRYRRACYHGAAHHAGRCWCAITDAVTRLPDFWIGPDGDLTQPAQVILQNPSQANLNLRDRFGNTPLHLFAARDGFQMQLVAMVVHGTVLDATNTADQTFLHVLAPAWFSGLSDQYAPLLQLLTHLRSRYPDLVYARDVYGRTFFHRLDALGSDPDIVAGILRQYDPVAVSRRDALGNRPLGLSEPPLMSPRTFSDVSPLDDDGGAPPSPSFPSEDAFIRHHESLLRIITASDSNPNVEDPEGRNGLHCLAEAIVDKKMMDEHRNALSTGRRPVKRKFDKKTTTPPSSDVGGGGGGDEGGGGGGGGGGGSSSSSTSSSIPQLATRLRLVRGLLSPPSVDVNHYDRQGNTVLMAFVTHLPDDQEDKAKNLSTILETLVASGARIEGRNRRGETALLVAARLGRKIALAALLEHGANVRARDADGRGVLDIIDEHCRGARNDVTLYGRLEACRVILTGKKQEQLGVQQYPSIVDEWTARAPPGLVGPMDMSS